MTYPRYFLREWNITWIHKIDSSEGRRVGKFPGRIRVVSSIRDISMDTRLTILGGSLLEWILVNLARSDSIHPMIFCELSVEHFQLSHQLIGARRCHVFHTFYVQVILSICCLKSPSTYFSLDTPIPKLYLLLTLLSDTERRKLNRPRLTSDSKHSYQSRTTRCARKKHFTFHG